MQETSIYSDPVQSLPLVGWNLGKTSFEVLGSRHHQEREGAGMSSSRRCPCVLKQGRGELSTAHPPLAVVPVWPSQTSASAM